jgi:hypothetical protein
MKSDPGHIAWGFHFKPKQKMKRLTPDQKRKLLFEWAKKQRPGYLASFLLSMLNSRQINEIIDNEKLNQNKK